MNSTSEVHPTGRRRNLSAALAALVAAFLLFPQLCAQTISITPPIATTTAGSQVQFTFDVGGISTVQTPSVRWLMSGPQPWVGSIDQTGLYTAPIQLAAPAIAYIQVGANLQAPGQTTASARFGYATVFIAPSTSGQIGPAGPPGKDGGSVTVSQEPPGPNCQSGGIKATDAKGNSAYACAGPVGAQGVPGIGLPGPPGATGGIGPQGFTGSPGPTGPAGGSVTVSQEPPGPHCPTGGAKFVDAQGNTAYACSAPVTSPTAGLCDDTQTGVIACSEGPPCTTYVCTCVDGEIVSCP